MHSTKPKKDESSDDKKNVYAFNIRHEEKHISEVESGRKGYYCMGCRREMQAMKSRSANRISFFRHDPEAVKGLPKCTYSDETYRHKLAKDILQRTLKIKVPSLYKYPPSGEEGLANLIEEAKFIEASSVGIERCFYEDNNGNICWGKKDDIDGINYLFQPDVTFFDKTGKPVLLIEIIATHKIKPDKLVKIKRIGINTIQVNIPKSSPEDIENIFKKTDKTKWIYNYEQENAPYIPTTEGNTATVLPIDEDQRKLFEESFTCRAAEIRNLIRSIERCLESEPYRGIEGAFRSEIQRVEDNTERDSERLLRLQEQHRIGIEDQFRERRELLATKNRELNERRAELGRRYQSAKISIGAEIEGVIGEIRKLSQSIEERRGTLRGDEERVSQDIERELDNQQRLRKEIDGLDPEFRENETRAIHNFRGIESREEAEIRGISNNREQLPAKFERLQEEAKQHFEYFEREEENAIGTIEAARAELPGEFDRKGSELDQRFEELRTETIRSFKERIPGGSTEFTKEIKKCIGYRVLLDDFHEKHNLQSRLIELLECIKTGSYKHWI